MPQTAPAPGTPDRPAASGLLPIRQDLRLLSSFPERGGAPAWALYDPMRNQYFRMGQRALSILNRWRPETTAAELAAELQDEGVDIDAREVTEFETFLRRNHLTIAAGPEETRRLAAVQQGRRTGLLTWLLKNYLYIRIPLFRPDRLLEATLPWIAFLFSAWTWRLIVVLGVGGIFLVLRQWETFITTFEHFFTAGGLLVFALTLFTVKAFHEFGHAYTAKRLGCRVPTMGIAFLVLYPMLYTDTTDAWRLPSHRQRLQIALAGVRVELALALLATFAWSFLPQGPLRSAVFFVATVSWVSSLMLNLSPFMRFDGYYALADWLEAENLQSRAFALARWQLREWILGLGQAPPETFARPRRRLFILFAWGTWIYRFFLFLGIALLVYHAVFKALGIVLFTVEIVWFILLPVGSELRVWWRLRRNVRFSPRRLLPPALLATALVVLFIPWQSETGLVGVLKTDRFTQIYPRENGRVEAVLVRRTQRVTRGQPLLRLDAPDLRQRQALLRVRVRLLRTLMDRQLASPQDLSRLSVLQQQMAEALSDLEGLRQRAARLVVRAPFTGKMTLRETLHPGQWLSRETPVASLASEEGARVEAYVEEDQLQRILPDATGAFLARDGQHPWIPVRVTAVDTAAETVIEDPMLASIHGGPIPARKTGEGTLRPEKALYRIRLAPAAAIAPPAWQLPGTVRLKGRSGSLAGRFWRHALAVMIRETGF